MGCLVYQPYSGSRSLRSYCPTHRRTCQSSIPCCKKSIDPAMWKRLDAAILQWIYGTISSDLLLAILRCDDTAEGAWKRLEALFQDNKASRVTHLEEDFTNAVFEEQHTIDNYCNYLQSLADRLVDVDAPVSNGRLVLRLTGSFPEAYNGTVDFIQNQEPLPSFESCR
ncbi:uncharacterized protein LOC120177641 [Hibiscus syriacus]|uniref:uncharacterized protein LOC120177641 n=1 Tax=Hibiscus syriacus TaxID=106335 RepID=UPI001923BCEA|nr:uncharacterized protein LOC120177641 [Hibiscus syriacus]